jgi:hypothetical protein
LFTWAISSHVRAKVDVLPSRTIGIREIHAQILSRDEGDRVYSGQIRSEAGLRRFRERFGIDSEMPSIDFEKNMLVFGLTDRITTRAYRLVAMDLIRYYVLDYSETGIKYKLMPPGEGKKHSYLQIFVVERIEGIAHVQVRNFMGNGLSRIFE